MSLRDVGKQRLAREAIDISLDANNVRDRIPENALSFSFARSGGPGGQNVNKVNTRVTLWFDLAGSPGLTEAEKRRIAGRLPGRVTKDGQVFIVSSSHRTQSANRAAAVERFYELIADALKTRRVRRPTRVPASAHRKRLEQKRRTGEKRALRKPARFSEE